MEGRGVGSNGLWLEEDSNLTRPGGFLKNDNNDGEALSRVSDHLKSISTCDFLASKVATVMDVNSRDSFEEEEDEVSQHLPYESIFHVILM